MIVCIVADVLGKENNGTTIACLNLVRYLKSKGNTVRILCCDQDKKDLENYYIVPQMNLGRFLNKIVQKNEVSLAKVDTKVIEKAIDGADIVHIMIPFMLGRKTLEIAKRKNIPVTAGFHCQAENFTSHILLMNSRLANHLTYKNFYNHFYKNVDAIHYPTNFIKDVFEKHTGIIKKSYVISNGVNENYQPKKVNKPESLKNKFVILFIGRYSKEKSHKILIKAISKCKYNSNIQLILAGSGPRKNEIIRYSKKRKINPPIMKFYNKEELIDVINYSDLYCHPAEIEIEAIACLEAITCGLVPIINNSSRCATKYFALNENNLFKYNDATDLALKIQYWYENKDKRKECSGKYLGYTKQFNQKNCMEQMEKMLIETINQI